jgi:group II intron reverse transcriptase/maturase
MNYVLEVDLRDFFGSLNHDWLRKFLGLRIGDKRILKLIDAWLKAGVMEEGQVVVKESGTPQGGSISPLLSNIYLHYVLDLWFEKKIRGHLKGRAHLVRYADDFSIFFTNEEDMKTVKALLITRLAQFGLTIADDKTHMTDLTPGNNGGGARRRMTFLGFNIFRALNRNGNGWMIMFKTENKRFTRAKLSMKQRLWSIKHFDLKQQAKIINSILQGHYNYYGFAGNSRRIVQFWELTYRYWKRCLFRRSQKELSWIKFQRILEQYALKRPVTKIKYGDLQQYARL